MQPTREIQLPTNKIEVSVKTDPGCVRETNEDNGRHVIPSNPENGDGRGTLTIVADGMGGHSAGEVASEMAVDLISQYFYSDEENPGPEALRNAIESANMEIYSSSMIDEAYSGMGTTVVALVIQNCIGYVAHVGDSRLYRLRDQNMERLTIDHSQVMEMVKLGIISLEDAQHHEDKNVILRAVGTQSFVEVEVSEPFAIEPGDEFLLCSDGLCDMANDDEIHRIWVNAPDVHAASEQLIAFAKQRGGEDNITVGVIHVWPQNQIQVERKVPVTREIGV